MKYRFIKGVVTEAGVRSVGDITDQLTDYEVRVFLHYGKIVPHDESRVVAREPIVEHRDPVVEVATADAPLIATERKRGRPRKL